MPITKRVEVDKIEIFPKLGVIQYRRETTFEEDGVELSKSYERAQFKDEDVNDQSIPLLVRQMWDEPDFRVARENRQVREGRAQGGGQ